jgi:hypothetical protein
MLIASTAVNPIRVISPDFDYLTSRGAIPKERRSNTFSL